MDREVAKVFINVDRGVTRYIKAVSYTHLEQPQEEKEMYVNPILDEMNKNQNWVCPIQTVSSDPAASAG